MFGLGTLINTAAILAGGALGLLLGRRIGENLSRTMLAACGISTILIGTVGVAQYMLVYEDGTFSTRGGMLLILSLVLGGLCGELLRIEDHMDRLGEKLRLILHTDTNSRFVEGFVNTTLIACVGAMSIVGAVEDGMYGNVSTLAVKSVLDFVTVLLMASSYGVGALFSAVPVLLYEGGITLFAHFAGNSLPAAVTDQVCFIGNALIFMVGVNVAFGKKVRVGNMLPAILIPLLYALGVWLFSLIF